MKTDGHYDVVRYNGGGDITAIKCMHCSFSVAPRNYFRAGDKSGQGRYNRARAVVVKHLHAEHRPLLSASGDLK